MRERLIRVERFEDLRAGMIVVVKRCRWCSAESHRVMLLHYDPVVELSEPDGSLVTVRGWRQAQPACDGRWRWISTQTVASGRVYRVDDGLDLAAETAKAKRKPVDTQQAWLDALRAYERAR